MSFFNYIGQWINENSGKAVGAFLGFLFGVLIFTVGIIKTLLIVLFVLIGFLIGKSRDDDVSIIDEITGLFRRNKGDDTEDI